MAFIKEKRSYNDERQAKDWQYLQDLGIRTIWGKLIGPDFCHLIVDREKRCYLLPLGSTNPNRDNIEISYYALCICDKVIHMEVDEQYSGCGSDKTFECHRIINKIEFPSDWSFDLVEEEELKKIIRDAFATRTYNETLTHEKVKSLTVDFDMAFGEQCRR